MLLHQLTPTCPSNLALLAVMSASAALHSALVFQLSSQVQAECMSHLTAATRACQYHSDLFSSILSLLLKGSQLPVAGLH